MKKFLLSFFIYLSFAGFSQKYQPIDSTMIWRDYTAIKKMNGGYQCCYEEEHSSYQFHGYEINNGHTWLKMYKSAIHNWVPCQNQCNPNVLSANYTDGFQGYLWDDSLTKKVYFTTTLTANFVPTTTNTIYDYLNKNLGDSLGWSAINLWGPSSIFYKGKIIFIDSILIGLNYHKRFTVQNYGILGYDIHVVQGIGSFRAAWNSIPSDFEYTSKLVCASKNSFAITPTSYTTYVASAGICATLTTLSEVEIPPFSIYPNPASSILHIDHISYEHAMVTDIFGKIVLEQASYSEKINIQQLPPGLYFISIRSRGIAYSSKFVKE